MTQNLPLEDLRQIFTSTHNKDSTQKSAEWSLITKQPTLYVDLWIVRHNEEDAITLQSVLTEATGEMMWVGDFFTLALAGCEYLKPSLKMQL